MSHVDLIPLLYRRCGGLGLRGRVASTHTSLLSLSIYLSLAINLSIHQAGFNCGAHTYRHTRTRSPLRTTLIPT